MQHSTTITPLTATEQGALDGHGVDCTCGAHFSTSLSEREARRQAAAHLDWHRRNDVAAAEYGRLAASA